jgi:hypothetical protein
LMWDQSPDAACIGDFLYYGQVGQMPAKVDVGYVTNTVVSNLVVGKTYLFYLTAYDAACNESDPSTVLNYTVPDFVRVTVSCSKEIDGTNWMEIFRETSFTTNATWFYRVTIQRTQ